MKYRKKPVVFEAFQMTPENIESLDFAGWPKWLLTAHDNRSLVYNGRCDDPESTISILTSGGPVFVNRNDWIIKGMEGGLYSCNPDLFEVLYEPILSS